jgi:hypothetical protein
VCFEPIHRDQYLYALLEAFVAGRLESRANLVPYTIALHNLQFSSMGLEPFVACAMISLSGGEGTTLMALEANKESLLSENGYLGSLSSLKHLSSGAPAFSSKG